MRSNTLLTTATLAGSTLAAPNPPSGGGGGPGWGNGWGNEPWGPPKPPAAGNSTYYNPIIPGFHPGKFDGHCGTRYWDAR